MTEQAEAGSVAEGEAPVPAGTPAEPPAPPQNGSAEEGSNPFAGLQDEGTRQWVETKGYKTLDEALKGGMNAEAKLGTVVTIPAPDAPKEEWDKFLARMPEDRRPVEAPDKLDFKRPEGLPESLPYNDELAAASKPWMHEAGLSKAQAQTMHDKFVGWMAEQQQAQIAQAAQAVEKAHDDLVRDWGPMDGEKFKQNLALADRALKKLGLAEAYKARGLLLDDGSLTDAQIARAMQAVGQSMFADDKIDGGEVFTGPNPFIRDAKGERDIAGINALVKSDPEKAKRMAKAAGENPDLWVSSNPY